MGLIVLYLGKYKDTSFQASTAFLLVILNWANITDSPVQFLSFALCSFFKVALVCQCEAVQSNPVGSAVAGMKRWNQHKSLLCTQTAGQWLIPPAVLRSNLVRTQLGLEEHHCRWQLGKHCCCRIEHHPSLSSLGERLKCYSLNLLVQKHFILSTWNG